MTGQASYLPFRNIRARLEALLAHSDKQHKRPCVRAGLTGPMPCRLTLGPYRWSDCQRHGLNLLA